MQAPNATVMALSVALIICSCSDPGVDTPQTGTATGSGLDSTGVVDQVGTVDSAGTETVQPDAAPQADVAVVDSTAPDTTAPDTTAPDTNAPDTNAPDTTAPDTTASDTTAPDTTAADTTAADTTAADATAADTTVADTTAADAAGGGCCMTSFDCPPGDRCVGNGGPGFGVCKATPAWGACWSGDDCSPTQTCSGGFVCPCDASCDQADALGTCQGGDDGCCTGAGVCPAGSQCMALSGIGWSTCVAKAEPGRCWHNSDCAAGDTCEGASFCPCSMDCDGGYEGPGVCTPPAPACTAIKPAWVKEWCNAASLVIWDGSSCVGTCPGCCACEPFCDETFTTMASCKATCQPTGACVLFGGDCDAAMPDKPWWALTADGCISMDSCVCEGCPGAFATAQACEQACQ